MAYLNQAQTFTAANTFSAAGTALTVTNNASIGGTLTVTGAISSSSTISGTTLNASSNLTLNSSASGGLGNNTIAKNMPVGTGGVSNNDVVVLINDAGNAAVVRGSVARDTRVYGVATAV